MSEAQAEVFHTKGRPRPAELEISRPLKMPREDH
jgi:hypothetical protein